jgi:hypothetical protein
MREIVHAPVLRKRVPNRIAIAGRGPVHARSGEA